MASADILFIVLGAVCLLIGFIGCAVPGIPGTPLCWGGLLLGSFASKSSLTVTTLVITAVVVVAVEIINDFVPSIFTKKVGGSKAGARGATIGVFAGLLTGQWWGILAGPFLGAFIGELIHDNSNTKRALKSAGVSFLGFLTGTGLKLICAAALIIIFIHSFF